MSGGAAAAAAVAAMNQAIKSMGTIVKVEPDVFMKMVQRQEAPLVVRAKAGFLWNKHAYLVSYKGFVFYTLTGDELPLPGSAEIVVAKSIYIPG